jgi:general nucleoside transport system ATP-binding protein
MTLRETPIIEMHKIVKTFPGVLANDNVDFTLRKGEVHALLGENGAGKTTLMKILYGLYPPDHGEIRIHGKPVIFNSARDAIDQGFGMVHQHFMLVPSLTVAKNIILGQKSTREPFIENLDDVAHKLEALSNQYGLEIRPNAKVWTLSVGEQQRVEILKALYRGAEVLILDEPTAVLTPQEADKLIGILKKLAESGKSIIFISHKLREVMALTDRVTILRAGKVVDTVQTSATSINILARMMVGREISFTIDKIEARPKDLVLEVKDLSAVDDRNLPVLKSVNLEVRGGEILGIAGVAGNGQAELEEVIMGLRNAEEGEILIGGHQSLNANPSQVGFYGLAAVPADRYKHGFFTDFSVAENLILERVDEKPFSLQGRLQLDAIQTEAAELSTRFDIRTPSVEIHAGKLSGGNIQKIILAREIARDPKVLLAAQPVRGLDINAIDFVHKTIIEQRDAGVAVLLISYDLDEIMKISDKIAVIYDGRLSPIYPIQEITRERIGILMGGATDEVDRKSLQ